MLISLEAIKLIIEALISLADDPAGDRCPRYKEQGSWINEMCSSAAVYR